MRVLIILSFLILPEILTQEYTFDTKYVNIPLDHFSFANNLSFTLKYLVNDTFYVQGGPIFFYAGNEGDINMFAQNTGFMFDIAPEFNALIIFAEHRYYGESLPFGDLSYSSLEYLGYLTATQALADFVYLINELQKIYAVSANVEKLPVIAFGGSYGGMLATWLKMKYPNSIVGAIASSAPIWQFKDQNPCDDFYKIITNVFESLGGEKCTKTIKDSWAIIRSITEDDAGKAQLSEMWNFCEPFSSDQDIDTLVGWLSEVYSALAETNYPYPTSFLVPLPANPVKEFCNKINSYEYDDDIGLLKAVGEALQIYTNYSENAQCNSLDSTSEELGESGWNFQACTEMIMPLCSKDADMFENIEWNFQEYSDDCYELAGIRPRSEEVPILEYGGKDLSTANNIVFSNGLLDPWSGYGVLSNYTENIVAVVILEGAHHSDLRASNENDPESVQMARQVHRSEITKWLDKYYADNNITYRKFST